MRLSKGDYIVGRVSKNIFRVLRVHGNGDWIDIVTIELGDNSCNDHKVGGVFKSQSPDNYKKLLGYNKEKQMDKKQVRSWGFHIQSKYQVDIERIAETLSTKDPVAIVKNSVDSKVICVVDRQFMRKLFVCKGGKKILRRVSKLQKDERYTTLDLFSDAWEMEQEDLSEFLQIWKDLRNAPFKESERCNADVTVTLARI